MKNIILTALSILPFISNRKKSIALYKNKFTGVIVQEKSVSNLDHYELHTPDEFLSKISGIIHIGANIGQEIGLYNFFSLNVIWVEPIPEIFSTLQNNISKFPMQHAIECLLSDVDGEDFEFKISNNNGLSSSILDIAQHADIWPDVHFTESIQLKSTTLNTLVEQQKIDVKNYQALVMDTQGTELLILKGATEVLKNFNYIKTEAPDFEAYTGCCLIEEIANFLEGHGFKELSRNKFAERENGGSYFDVIFQRN